MATKPTCGLTRWPTRSSTAVPCSTPTTNYAETALKVTTASVNAFLRQMDAAKNVVKLIFR